MGTVKNAQSSALQDGHNAFLDTQRKPTRYEYPDLVLYAPEGVYHPAWDSSTSFVIAHLPLSIRNSEVLDLGCGSGAIGLHLADPALGNRVILSDVDPAAMATAQINAMVNGLLDQVQVIQADLFEHPALEGPFDCIIWNYPMWQKPIEEPLERIACDPGGRLMQRFLAALPQRLRHGGTALVTYSNYADQDLLEGNCRWRGLDATLIAREMRDSGFERQLWEVRHV